MYKIKAKDGNKSVTIQVNGVIKTLEFNKSLNLSDNTVEILTSAGYEVNEIKKEIKEDENEEVTE